MITRTHIGYGSPNRQDTAKAHGEPLGAAEIVLTKQAFGWPWTEPFAIPTEALAHWRQAERTRGRRARRVAPPVIAYAKAHPDDAKEFGRRVQGDLPAGWQQAIPTFTAENGNIASRAASGMVLNAIAARIPGIGRRLHEHPVAGRNIPLGREHAMGAS